MRELSAPMSRLVTVRVAVLVVSVSLTALSVLASPASADRLVNEFVRAKCDSTLTVQRVVRWYSDGTTDTSSSTEHPRRRISLRADYRPKTVDLEVRWVRDTDVPLAATSYSYSSPGTSEAGTAEGSTSLEVRLHLGKRVLKLRRLPDWSESRLPKRGDDNHAHPFGFAITWDLTIPLLRHLDKVRRHEARGGKTRVSLHYTFPKTTTVETVDIESYEGVAGQSETTLTYSAVNCSAKSRPGTLTRR
jgi:hypothetical protein